MNLTGKIVLVTGAAVRVGRAIAREMAGAGANLIVHHFHHEEEAREAADEFESMGVRAIPVKADISQADQVDALFKEIDETFGRIDVLVNNAAVFERTPFPEMTEEDWDFHIDINLKGTFLCCREASRRMIDQGDGGKIVNIADVFGAHPWPGYLPYCVSKAGVVTLTRTLAISLGKYQIQVNAIGPGAILFPEDFPEDLRDQVVSRIPARRSGAPEDIAQTARFLIEGPDYITGALLPVDGGASLT